MAAWHIHLARAFGWREPVAAAKRERISVSFPRPLFYSMPFEVVHRLLVCLAVAVVYCFAAAQEILRVDGFGPATSFPLAVPFETAVVYTEYNLFLLAAGEAFRVDGFGVAKRLPVAALLVIAVADAEHDLFLLATQEVLCVVDLAGLAHSTARRRALEPLLPVRYLH